MMRKTVVALSTTLVCGLALFTLPVASHAYVPGDFTVLVLSDDFNDNSLDAAKWQTKSNITGFGGYVNEQNQQIEGWQDGWLYTKDQYTPATQPLLITGDGTIVVSTNIVGVTTRSDGVLAAYGGYPGYIGSKYGLDAEFIRVGDGWGGVSSLDINIYKVVNGTKTLLAPTTKINTLSGIGGGGESFRFQMLDDGTHASFRVTPLGAGRTGEAFVDVSLAGITGLASTGYVLMPLHGSSGANSIIDNVSIYTVPEPGSLFALGTGLIGLLGFAVRRRQ